ncbi:DUF3011 domain-containing protein [Fimbriimonas ginsengisoli]|uniref:DUF3011 domain-containing protein n=1 Tax=Fimbriimonas ginsengisoli Gsoil 348 TaxID=661478 RepID=A0A068NS46_FIMGI|nr:DUF3011 domain-containing protein [Fimbriimonas ginsengisoli]AIE86378.1 hypothetical protein OP10G_3010 [Fimbriimonas ginsengisoli Gsoil 348]
MKQTTKVAVRGTAVVLGAAIAAFGFAFVQARMTVESRDGRRAYRRIDDRRYENGNFRVRLIRRLSDAACIEGRSWGYDRNGIWVDRGCRAEFEITTSNWGDDRGNGDPWNNSGWHNGRWNGGQYDERWRNRRNNGDTRQITIQGRGERRAYTRIDTRGGVRLVRRLSDAPCEEGRSWGYDQNGIWVSRGCRAIFEINSYRGRSGDWGRNGDRIRD